jgi:hypothetical protein
MILTLKNLKRKNNKQLKKESNKINIEFLKL